MAITPTTNLFILKNPLQIDNKNQLTFANKTAQFNYFHSLDFLQIDNISYQRKDSMIRFPAHIDKILQYNYCMYQNENYGDKWFYAFITNMRYVNDNMTEIYIKTDVYQTWQFDLEIKECFVEREMIPVAEDVPGANLVPEGLETGEFKIQSSVNIPELQPVAVLAYTRNPKDDGLTTEDVSPYGTYLNGIPAGVYYYICSFNLLPTIIEDIATRNHTDAIMTIFTLPALAVIGFQNSSLNDWINGYGHWVTGNFKANPVVRNAGSTPEQLDGYTPINKKLLTYPYCYVGFTPPNGSQKIYRFEDFGENTNFNIISEINQNPIVCMIPQNYRGETIATVDSVNLSGYPTLGWITEYFNTWLAQNSEIINLQMNQEQFNYEIGQVQSATSGLSNIIKSGLNGGSADYGGTIGQGIGLGFDLARNDVNHEYYIKNQMAQIEKQQLLPNTGHMSSNNATMLGYNYLHLNIFNTFTIKRQFAERIDKFFNCYGYLTNKIKSPNLHNRPNWNYLKTIGMNIQAHIPQNDLQELKNMFDNGITLWHNTNTFMDYTQNNR